jgi:hypothetical protein
MSQSELLTTDVYEAAFLLTRGVPYRGASFDGSTVQFQFAATDCITDYRNNAEVPVLVYGNNLRFINAELKRARRSGGAR